jgi:hypothetical protein
MNALPGFEALVVMVGDRTCNTAQRRNANAVNLDKTNVGGTAPEHELGIPNANRVDVCRILVVHENADALPVDEEERGHNNPTVGLIPARSTVPRHDNDLGARR